MPQHKRFAAIIFLALLLSVFLVRFSLASPTDSAVGNIAAIPVATATATQCPNPFVDINGNIFSNAILTLYCRGVISGSDATHYSPAGTATRAQFAKILVGAYRLTLTTPSNPNQTFTDVPPSYYAYAYIETGFAANILDGFDQPTCQAAGRQFPCYIPNRSITRAQLTKLVVEAAGYTYTTPASPSFNDVPSSNIFYTTIETAHAYNLVNGYPDGSFRPSSTVRRDEMASIIYRSVGTARMRSRN